VTEVVRWYWYELGHIHSPYPNLTLDRSLAREITVEQHQEILSRFSVFKNWFMDHYQLSGSHNRVFALHTDTILPRYRDQYPGNSNPEVPGLRATYLSAILEAPELAIPSEYPRIEFESQYTIYITDTKQHVSSFSGTILFPHHRQRRTIATGCLIHGRAWD
jgi:hypothetical protein